MTKKNKKAISLFGAVEETLDLSDEKDIINESNKDVSGEPKVEVKEEKVETVKVEQPKVEVKVETKPEPVKVSNIYDSAINKVEEAKQAVIKEHGVVKTANDAVALAEKIKEAEENSKPLILHYNAKEPIIKVNYFITQKQKDKVKKVAAAYGAKPSHIIAQLIDAFMPDYIEKKIKEGK